MYYRERGKVEVPAGRKLSEVRKERFRKLTRDGPPPGLLGYLGRKPVGWIALGPRTDYIKLQNSPVMKPVDEEPVWSVLCFVVPAEHRHQGVAGALLEAAVEYARKGGARLLEAYPFDKKGDAKDEWLWHGTKRMFDRAGFSEVARRKPERPIVRLEL